MSNIMNFIEKQKLVNRMPKDKRADLKMIMGRTNFYEVSDMGNEQYVLNVIDQGCVVEKTDTEGHLHLMCATSRFNMKILRYKMTFGEKNEIVVLRTPDDGLTDAEEIALDSYIAEFSSTIKKQLHYQVEYRVEYVENKAREIEIERQESTNQAQNLTQAQNKNIMETANILNEKVEINPLEAIRKEIENKEGDVLTLTAYARNGKFGVGVDLGSNTVADLVIEDNVDLLEVDVIRAAATAITLAQTIGTYTKLKQVKNEVNYYFFQDREVFIEIPGAFTVINQKDLEMANN